MKLARSVFAYIKKAVLARAINAALIEPSLQDQDKQQIRFFVLRFTVKYSDRLVETTALKVLHFQFLKVLGSG